MLDSPGAAFAFPSPPEGSDKSQRQSAHSSLELPLRDKCGIKDPEKELRNWKKRLKAAIRETPASHSGHRLLRKCLVCGSDWNCFHSQSQNRFLFQPLQCDKKICPSCLRAWSLDLTVRALPAAGSVPFTELRHLVLTIKNCEHSMLPQTLDCLFSSFREWRNQGRRSHTGKFWTRVKGYIAKLEIDCNSSSFHPHLHCLLHVPSGFDFGYRSLARSAWIRIIESHGSTANPSAQYITNCQTSDVAREVTKYCAKPLQMEALRVQLYADLLLALNRRRFFSSWGTLACPKPTNPDPDLEHLGSLSHLVTISEQAGPDRDFASKAIEAFCSLNYGNQATIDRAPYLAPMLGGFPNG